MQALSWNPGAEARRNARSFVGIDALNVLQMRAQLTRQDHVKTTSRPRQDPANLLKKRLNRRHFRPRIPPWNNKIRSPPGNSYIFDQALTCSCHNNVFATVLLWSTENDEFTCVRSTPKSIFLGNGDDSFGARGGLDTTRTLKIVAVLGNYAVFRSARALHHRNPRPLQSLSVTNVRISRTALRFC